MRLLNTLLRPLSRFNDIVELVGKYGDEWLMKLQAAVGDCEAKIDAEFAEFAG